MGLYRKGHSMPFFVQSFFIPPMGCCFGKGETPMNYLEAMEYITRVQTEYASHYTLEKVTCLCERMGRPERSLRIIHIAGTNGKGSVGAFISNALAMCGYTVGRYVSPTILDYREKIQRITGNHFSVEVEWISQEETAGQLTRLSQAARDMEEDGQGHPTAFELETVMAFCQMKEWQVDVAVIETGLGGTLDATNLVEKPVLTVFTEISQDHITILGGELEEIAEQKFGIIKAGVPVVSLRQQFPVMEKLRNECQKKGLHLRVADPERMSRMEFTLTGTKFDYKGNRYFLKQLGVYQPENAIVALEALEQLKGMGFHRINLSGIQSAFRETRWRGRFEFVSQTPFLILDGAHNVSGAKALRCSLETYFPGERFTLVFGVFRDKDYQRILREMLPLGRRMYTVKAEGDRGMEPEELAQVVRKSSKLREIPVVSCQSIEEVFQKIRHQAQGEKIIVFGSLSFLKEVYPLF